MSDKGKKIEGIGLGFKKKYNFAPQIRNTHGKKN
jgi:hypothetical protein